MQVAQRGTSEGPSSLNGVLALDRWYVNSSGGTKTISQQTFTVGQTDVPGFPKNYVRLEVTTGDNNTGIHQRVEDVTSIAGKTVTLSFWAKGTNPTGGSFVSSWIQNFGSGGSSNVETEAKSGIVLTSSWQKFTITFTVPSVAGKTIGAGSYTWVELLRQPATDTGTGAWTADIALAQLEVGSVATEFEHRSYSEELQLCQRYFQYYKNPPIRGVVYSSTRANRLGTMLPVIMRANPSVTIIQTGSLSHFRLYDGSVTAVYSSFNASYLTPDKIEFDINVTGSSLTGGRAACLYDSTNTYESAFLIDAEL
jgi:hypothetical protein